MHGKSYDEKQFRRKFYGQDMFFDVPIVTDLIAIQERHQALIDSNLMRHNRKQFDYKYQIGENVMIKVYDPNKGEEKLHGPYPITELCINGTVKVRRDPHGYIEESFNLRRIEPYKGLVAPQPNPYKVQNILNIQCKKIKMRHNK